MPSKTNFVSGSLDNFSSFSHTSLKSDSDSDAKVALWLNGLPASAVPRFLRPTHFHV